ncbi:hypothetical protein B0H16DRAFT_1326508 [Mycena metata]|uniref:Reverse transcriptase zinc-binding domain-containing protein n=1 Tax=Mycena metata TaxID=1033252 RepID=A0AAD7MYJ6_9AGAR|nr:hypothetical protein B0H16DRAFT_1326508 [Mycena metata]
MAVLERLQDRNHERTKECVCEACIDDKISKRCENPNACIKALERKLSGLLPKWDPRRYSARAEDTEHDTPGTFKPPPAITSLEDGFRILTRRRRNHPQTQLEATIRDPSALGTSQTIFIGSATQRNEEGEPIAGGSIWYGPEHEKNLAIRVPMEHTQSMKSADIYASLLAVQRVPRDQELRIVNSKDTTRMAMTRNLEKLENRGWIGVPDSGPLKALAAELKARSAKTVFVDASSESGSRIREGERMARLIAKEDLSTREPSKISIEIEASMSLDGAKLSTLTQKLAYAGIEERKAEVSRKATDNNVKQVRAAIKLQNNKMPTTAQVWTSIRHKDFTRQVRNFLWKSLHSAHRIGIIWKHIPECEDREICQFCDEPEDLEHILLKCKHPGQQEVWELAKNLWLKKHPSWPMLSLGSILGCGLAEFADENGRPLLGTTRLYRIIISESLFMIWKIRNDCVINRAGAEMPKHEIHNKWLYAINLRLKFDRALTNHAKFGKQNSIKVSLVLQTWRATLMDEEKLPENWIREPRVLVGTEQQPSNPPSPPPGRGGRNR